jgi:GntR family transcriptional repressor for pyruvate dehydrogenase complex
VAERQAPSSRETAARRPGSRVDGVAEALVSAIIAGDYRPGDRLPNLEELAVQYSAGRSVVREAIRSLVARGLVTVRHGEGTFVKTPQIEDLRESLSVMIHLAAPDNRQLQLALMDIRLVLETAAAWRAAERATDEDLADLSRVLDSAGTAIASGDTDTFLEVDIRFHALVARASHNPVLLLLLEVVTPLLRGLRHATLQLDPEHTSNEGHEAILSAIARHNPAEAEAEARRHLESMMNVLYVHVLGLRPVDGTRRT